MKTLIVSALHAEARPLVDHLGLLLDASTPMPIFKGEDTLLVVSGIGKVKAALAVGYLAAMTDALEHVFVLNIGVAGAYPSFWGKVGDLFIVNKIVDAGSNREFYPDMLVATTIDEATLTTHDKPVGPESWDESKQDLVDMEGSGFFEAAAAFFPPHRIACLKIVSDFLEPRGLTGEIVTDLVSAKVGSISSFIALTKEVLGQEVYPIGPDEQEWIGQVVSEFRLSTSQRHMLSRWVREYRGRSGSLLPDLKGRIGEPVKTKEEGKRRLEEIRKELLPR